MLSRVFLSCIITADFADRVLSVSLCLSALLFNHKEATMEQRSLACAEKELVHTIACLEELAQLFKENIDYRMNDNGYDKYHEVQQLTLLKGMPSLPLRSCVCVSVM
jgi:hypothetical protein